MSPPSPTPDPRSPELLAQRVDALEVASGFAERRSDELGEQILALHQHVDRLLRRVHALESRLATLHESIDRADPAGERPADASGDQ